MASPRRKGKAQELLNDDEWTQFWRRGSVTTFERSGNPNYDGEIREFWQLQFGALPRGARVVDLATGNGAVALLAAEYSSKNRMQFEINALDKAEIRPQRDLERTSWPRRPTSGNSTGFWTICVRRDLRWRAGSCWSIGAKR